MFASSQGAFNGIFKSCYDKFGSSGLQNFFYLTGTKLHDERRGQPSILIDPSNIGNDNRNNWHSAPEPEAHFYIKFKKFPFLLTEYSIKTRNDFANHFPREYRVEGSNDNKTWTLLHYFNSTELSLLAINKTYLAYDTKRSFSIFKFTQIRTNTESNYFVLYRIEFFGIIGRFGSYNSCKTKRKIRISYAFMLHSVSS